MSGAKCGERTVAMKEFTYTIQDPMGLHARPAGLMVREAQKFESTITLHRGEQSANLRKLFALMALAVKQGETIRVTAQGSDEDAAAEFLERFIRENF